MSTTVDTPPTTAPAKKTPANAPTTTLTVPARPAAVTAANVAALAGTAAAAAGPVGWAVAAVAGVVGAGIVARRVTVRRRGGRSSSPGFGSGGSSWRPGRTGGAHRASNVAAASRAGTNRRSGAGLPSLPASNGSRRKPSPRSSAARTAAPAPTSRTHADRAAQRTRRPNGSPATRSASRRVAQAAQRASAAIARPVGRVSRTIARRLANATRRGWSWLRRVVRRRILGLKNQPAPTVKPKLAQPRTGRAVRRPNPQTTTPRNTRGASTEVKEPAMTAKPQAPQGPVYIAARGVHAAAAEHKPKGNLEVRIAAYEAPFAIAEVAAAYEIIAQSCAQRAIRPEFAQAVAAVAAQIRSAAEAARRLGPAFDDIHAELVRRLLNPEVGEDAWDTSNNR